MNTIHYLQVVTADIIEAIDNTDNYRHMNSVENICNKGKKKSKIKKKAYGSYS